MLQGWVDPYRQAAPRAPSEPPPRESVKAPPAPVYLAGRRLGEPTTGAYVLAGIQGLAAGALASLAPLAFIIAILAFLYRC